MDTQMEKLLAAQERALQQKNEADRKAKQAKKQIEDLKRKRRTQRLIIRGAMFRIRDELPGFPAAHRLERNPQFLPERLLAQSLRLPCGLDPLPDLLFHFLRHGRRPLP